MADIGGDLSSALGLRSQISGFGVPDVLEVNTAGRRIEIDRVRPSPNPYHPFDHTIPATWIKRSLLRAIVSRQSKRGANQWARVVVEGVETRARMTVGRTVDGVFY